MAKQVIMNERVMVPPNGAKAVISLTSWKARINTVGLTIFSLHKQCPGFHIVLVLCEEEFPKKEDELPRNLRLMANAGILEFLWIKKNLKSFKKWCFTSLRYPTVPVISADDDCLYTMNYADALYQRWLHNKHAVYTFHKCPVTGFQHGPATLYPPGDYVHYIVSHITDTVLNTAHDDVYIGMCLNRKNIQIIEIDPDVPYIFHDTTEALSSGVSMNVFSAMEAISHELV